MIESALEQRTVRPLTVHRIFEQQATLFPQAMATVSAQTNLSYRDLDRLSNKIAGALRVSGLGSGDVVVVGLERSVEAIASFLGVLKAGGVYCPVDLQDTAARRRAMFEDAQPRAILTTRKLAHLFDEQPCLKLYVEEVQNLVESAWGDQSAELDADAPAALMFTSGSTGRPKGALIPHRGIVRLFFGSDYVRFDAQLRTLFHSPQHFDASTFEIWGPLLHGGCCGVFSGERIPSLKVFAEAIGRFEVNCLFLGPGFFNVIVEEDPQVLQGLRYVLVGGEKMSARHIRKAIELFPGTLFLNMYGPTETTTFATAYAVPADLAADAKTIPIGKPIAGTQCHLLDEQGNVSREGEVGELFIGGQGVALGYVNRPELTAQRFVPDRFNSNPAARMYRTGDLCKLLPDGNLDFVGRVDDQIKIRSHRIEPGEIESQMLEHPAVSQAIVVPIEQGGQTFLVAYYTANSGTTCTTQEVMEHLRQRLPAYLLPRTVIPLQSLPVTPSGKIDRSALPNPVAAASHTTETIAPQTAVERQLLDIWHTVLNDPTVGIDDSFFDRGGTSLDAIRLCLLVEKATEIFVPISVLLGSGTVRQFAVSLEKTRQSQQPTDAVLLAGSGDGAPIYFIAGETGHPLELRALAAALTGNRPVYGLQVAGMDGETPLLDSIEAIAQHLIPTIRRLSGSKPVHLLGYCFGGLVAYELACILEETSHNVGKLLLVDSWTAASVVQKPIRRRVFIRLQRGPFLLAKQIVGAIFGNQEPSEPPVYDGKLDRLIRDMQDANTAAYHKYQPRKYPGEFISIRALEDDNDLFMSDASGGWDQVMGGPVQIHQSPGDHSSMIRPPHVHTLARFVEKQLKDEE